MFMGEYNHSVDSKGRIIVPSKFRDELGQQFVVTLGLDGCLFMYPNDEWAEFISQLKGLPGSREARQLQRYFLAGAATCEMDKQGRILIPSKLREHTAVEKEVVFVGVLNKVEVWSKERWEANNSYENMDDIAEHMADFGLSF